MNVPKNVWSFEVLLYASLLLDALSLAFEDRTPRPGVTEQMITAQILFAAGMLVFVLYLIWLAARRRKGWPRWLLAVLVVLSLPQLAHVVAARGVGFGVVVDTVSAVLAAWGLYLSFTGDARDWFDA
jgi:hypothetical protein